MYTIGGELYHHGILGMHWGIRRYQPYSQGYQGSDGKYVSSKKQKYQSTGIGAYIARKKNEKVRKSFDDWKENDRKRSEAIDIGKRRNEAKMLYESDKSNKENKKAYKEIDREYKKSKGSNTTYRKGQVEHDVRSDLARKYLSEANKVKKEMEKNPSDELQKKYNDLMSKHDVELAKARRAPEKYANRSRKIASLKSMRTKAIKGAAAAAAIAVGVGVANKYIPNLNINSDQVKKAIGVGKSFMKYV